MHKNSIAILLIAFFGVVSSASAQSPAQSTIHQDASKTVNDGSRFGDSSSTPEADPAHIGQVDRPIGVGDTPSAKKAEAGGAKAQTSKDATEDSTCVGPASFCNIYF